MRSKILLVLLLLGSFGALAQSEKMLQSEVKADTLLNRQDFDGALKLYSSILKKTKEKDKFYFGILYKAAVSSYSSGKFDRAQQYLDEFVPAYPDFPQGHLLQAFVYREQDDARGQLQALNKALALQPIEPDLMKWRAVVYLQLDSVSAAKDELLKVSGIQDDAEVQTNLGFAYNTLGDAQQAYASINKAIALDATFQPAYLYGASFALSDTNYSLALEYANLLLRLDPKNPNALFYKGIALIETEKLDEGCSCLAKAFYAGEDDAGDYLTQYCYGGED